MLLHELIKELERLPPNLEVVRCYPHPTMETMVNRPFHRSNLQFYDDKLVIV